MSMRTNGLTEKTYEGYTGELQLFLRYLKDTYLFDIDHKVIDSYMFYCLDERKNGDSAMCRKHTALSSFFESMIRKDYFPVTFKNPMYKVDKMKIREVIKDFLTEDEFAMVIKHLEDKNDIRGICLVNLAYSSACRVSEIEQLNRDTISMENRIFKVKGKGEKERECYLSLQARESIINYSNTRTDDLKPLFLSRMKTRWKKRDIERYIADLTKKLGFTKHITPHSLRHSILTNMRLKGARLEDLQLLAGHASIATTQAKYTHVGLSDVSNTFDKFFER
jgi:site-specific recombinase XerD